MFVRFLSTSLTLSIFLSGCRTGVVPISRRAGGIPKINSGRPSNVGNLKNSKKSRTRTLFVKKSTIKIEPKKPVSSTGSLFNLDDSRNYLFTKEPVATVGKYLDINVSSKRIAKKENKNTDNAAKQDGDNELDSAFAKELREAFPNLDGGEDSPKILNKFKVRIMRILDNGDLLVSYNRESINDNQANMINFIARIPSSATSKSEGISTNDLFDVEWFQSANNEVMEQKSQDWEDEYTLRLSGFKEAKSRMALQLEEKGRRLRQLGKQVRTRAVNLGKQRNMLVKERDRLAKVQAKLNEDMQKMQQKIEEQKQMIEEQKQTIQELKPAEEKPEVLKEGDSGD